MAHDAEASTIAPLMLADTTTILDTEGDRKQLQAVLAANFTPESSKDAGIGNGGGGGLRAGAPARALPTPTVSSALAPTPAASTAAEQWAKQMAARFTNSDAAEQAVGIESSGGLSYPASQPSPALQEVYSTTLPNKKQWLDYLCGYNSFHSRVQWQ